MEIIQQNLESPEIQNIQCLISTKQGIDKLISLYNTSGNFFKNNGNFISTYEQILHHIKSVMLTSSIEAQKIAASGVLLMCIAAIKQQSYEKSYKSLINYEFLVEFIEKTSANPSILEIFKDFGIELTLDQIKHVSYLSISMKIPSNILEAVLSNSIKKLKNEEAEELCIYLINIDMNSSQLFSYIISLLNSHNYNMRKIIFQRLKKLEPDSQIDCISILEETPICVCEYLEQKPSPENINIKWIYLVLKNKNYIYFERIIKSGCKKLFDFAYNLLLYVYSDNVALSPEAVKILFNYFVQYDDLATKIFTDIKQPKDAMKELYNCLMGINLHSYSIHHINLLIPLTQKKKYIHEIRQKLVVLAIGGTNEISEAAQNYLCTLLYFGTPQIGAIIKIIENLFDKIFSFLPQYPKETAETLIKIIKYLYSNYEPSDFGIEPMIYNYDQDRVKITIQPVSLEPFEIMVNPKDHIKKLKRRVSLIMNYNPDTVVMMDGDYELSSIDRIEESRSLSSVGTVLSDKQYVEKYMMNMFIEKIPYFYDQFENGNTYLVELLKLLPRHPIKNPLGLYFENESNYELASFFIAAYCLGDPTLEGLFSVLFRSPFFDLLSIAFKKMIELDVEKIPIEVIQQILYISAQNTNSKTMYYAFKLLGKFTEFKDITQMSTEHLFALARKEQNLLTESFFEFVGKLNKQIIFDLFSQCITSDTIYQHSACTILKILSRTVTESSDISRIFDECVNQISKYIENIPEILQLMAACIRVQPEITLKYPNIHLHIFNVLHFIDDCEPVIECLSNISLINSKVKSFIDYKIIISKNNYMVSKRTEQGLLNNGATCFVNSIIQLLVHVRPFVENFLLADINKIWERELQFILSMLYFNVDLPDTSGFISNFKMNGEHIRTNVQEDAVEFLSSLLNDLPENLTKRFRGVFRHTFTGEDGTVIKELTENFFVLSLTADNIEDSMKIFGASEKLNDFQIDENTKATVTQTTRIKEAPEFLFVQLKRFEYQSIYLTKKKITKALEYSQELKIGKICDKPIKYSLLGTVSHIGLADFGHYFTHILEDNSYTKFNDYTVKRHAESPKEEEVYILLYRRNDVKNQRKMTVEDLDCQRYPDVVGIIQEKRIEKAFTNKAMVDLVLTLEPYVILSYFIKFALPKNIEVEKFVDIIGSCIDSMHSDEIETFVSSLNLSLLYTLNVIRNDNIEILIDVLENVMQASDSKLCWDRFFEYFKKINIWDFTQLSEVIAALMLFYIQRFDSIDTSLHRKWVDSAIMFLKRNNPGPIPHVLRLLYELMFVWGETAKVFCWSWIRDTYGIYPENVDILENIWKRAGDLGYFLQ